VPDHPQPPFSPSEKKKGTRREKRASLSREKIERERKEKMRVFLPHNPYIHASWVGP